MSDAEHNEVAPPGTDPDIDNSLLLPGVGEPLEDPGLPAHEPRPTDVDEAMARRAEWQVAAMFMAAGAFAVLFCVAYFAFSPEPQDAETVLGYGLSNLTMGTCLGLSLLLIGVGAIQWAKKLMGDEEIIEFRHSSASSEEDREVALAAFQAGAEESGFGRRTLVRNTMLGSMALLGLPAIVVLRDLGPLPGDALAETVWRKGVRVVNDVSGRLLKPEDIVQGQLVNAEPGLFFEIENPDGTVSPAKYEGTELAIQKTKATVILVRINPSELTPFAGREDWQYQGIVCYSKVCTHLGCPISLYEQQTHHVLCPCHQSTFDLADSGKVLFGPAARALPQLPIDVDSEGYLIATSDFTEPVGPSYWERG